MFRKLIFLSLFVSLSALAAEVAHLSVDNNANYNLGTQTQGEQVTATINFENTGHTNLEISKIKTPCGCTSVNLGKTVYKPGEKGSFEVSINTTRLKDSYDKKLVMFSNDSTQPEKAVRIHFKLQQPAAASGI